MYKRSSDGGSKLTTYTGASIRPFKKRYYYADKTKDETLHASQRPADYAISLLDPWNDIIPRIPDLACYPTAVAREETNFIWTLNTADTTANNQIMIVDFAETLAYFWCQSSATAAGTRLPGQYTNASLAASGVNYVGNSGLYAQFDLFRVVSAGIKIKFADNDTATKGIIWAATIPGSADNTSADLWQGSPFQDVSNATNVLNLSSDANWPKLKGVYCGPLVDGAVTRYQPTSATSFVMIHPDDYAATTQVSNFGRHIFYIQGAANGTVVHVNIVCNIEAIPYVNSQGVATEASPVSGASLEAGINAASAASNAFGGSASEINQNINTPVRYLNTLNKY